MIKRLIKRILLARCNVHIDFRSTIDYNPNHPHMKSPVLIINSKIGSTKYGDGCKFIDCTCQGNIEIGQFVSIAGYGTLLSSIQNKIIVGNYVSIGQNVNIQESNHRIDRITSYFVSRNIFQGSVIADTSSKGDIIIGDDVWIGANSCVLPGVKIGRGAVIGAGSVVTKNVPPYSIVVGSPARVLRKRFDDDITKKLEASRWWTWDMEKVIANKEQFLSPIEQNIDKLPTYTGI